MGGLQVWEGWEGSAEELARSGELLVEGLDERAVAIGQEGVEGDVEQAQDQPQQQAGPGGVEARALSLEHELGEVRGDGLEAVVGGCEQPGLADEQAAGALDGGPVELLGGEGGARELREVVDQVAVRTAGAERLD